MSQMVYGMNTEVQGRAIRSVVEGVATFSEVFETMALDILENNGISDPQPGEWYSMQGYLAAFEEIEDSVGPNTVEQIGRAIPEVVEWPPGVETVPEGLEQLDDVYQMNHRGGEIGHYEFEQTGPKSGTMTCENPYPCALDQGLVTGTVRKFADTATLVRVQEADGCRDEGSDTCVYSVQW